MPEADPAAGRSATGRRGDRIAAVVIFVVSAIYTRLGLSFKPFLRTEALGPATFPLLVGGMMLVLSAVLFAGSFRAPAAQHPPWTTYAPAVLLWVLLLGYSLAFDPLGFPLSTALFVFLALRLLRVQPWWRAALIAAAFALVAWYAFTGLDVRLPRGELFRR